jgi:FlaA1/EpsC-like NDP-sugar epimerase
MGEPVKVVDLAADMIRLYGLEVGTDIKIEFVGSRPGEKLYEEMFWGDEVAEQTEHPKVLRARNNGLADNYVEVIDELCQAGRRNAGEPRLRELLRAIVPDFAPSEESSPPATTPSPDPARFDDAMTSTHQSAILH